MNKKKEQVKHLKKSFAAVVKAFEKEKDKKRRKEAFEFLTGKIAEFRQCTGGDIPVVAAVPGEDSAAEALPVAHIVPSPALVDEIRSEHQHNQN